MPHFKTLLLLICIIITVSFTKSSIVLNKDFKPIVLFTKNSDPVSDKLVKYILKRTDMFCSKASKQGVKKILIEHSKKQRSTTVIYTCLGTDPSQLTEEILSSSEIHYISLPLLLDMLSE